jgi:uncharacterized protein (TIRG00374 family)
MIFAQNSPACQPPRCRPYDIGLAPQCTDGLNASVASAGNPSVAIRDSRKVTAPPTIAANKPASSNRKRPSRFRVPGWLRVTGSIVILGLTIWFLVIPQFNDAKDALTSLATVALPLVLLALVLELSSLASYSALTRTILAKKLPRYFTLLRIDLADVGLNHVVPGGGVTSGAVRLRLFKLVGIGSARAFTTATIEITGSNLVLGAVFAVGVAISISSFAGNSLYVTAAIAVLTLLAASAVAVWFLVQQTDRAVRWVRALVRHLPFIKEQAAEAFVRAMALQIRDLGKDRRRVLTSVGFALGNWVLDASALWVVFAAFGQLLGPGAILTVYGLGSILAQLPLTPGGLGIVEGVMVPAFIAFGVPPSIAVIGVIGWRLLEFWMPIPLAAVAYTSLRIGPLRRSPQIDGGPTLTRSRNESTM